VVLHLTIEKSRHDGIVDARHMQYWLLGVLECGILCACLSGYFMEYVVQLCWVMKKA